MTMDQIKMFLTVANCLNFTEAANILYMTVPTLSRQIRSMEEELNLLFFIRDNHSVRITPAGRTLLDSLEPLYSEYVRSVNDAKQVQRGMSAELKIGILDGHMLDSGFIHLVRTMDKLYPNILLNLFRASFKELTDSLYNGDADAIITIDFSLGSRAKLQRLTVSKTQEYLMVPKDSYFAKIPIILPEHLSGVPVVNVSQDDCPFSGECSKKLRHSTGCIEKLAPNLESSTLWIQAGLGIGIVNSHNMLCYNRGLTAIDLADVQISEIKPSASDMVLAWNKDNKKNALQNFLEICQDELRVGTAPIPANLRNLKG